MSSAAGSQGDSYRVLADIGVNNIGQEVIDAVWRGDSLSDVDKESLDQVARQLSINQLNSILSELRYFTKDVQLAPFIKETAPPKEVVKKTAAVAAVVVDKKKQQAKKKKKSRRKVHDSDDEEEMEIVEEQEEEEKEEEVVEEPQQQPEEEEEEEEELDMNSSQTPNDFLTFLEEEKIPVPCVALLMYWLVDNAEGGKEVQCVAASIYLHLIVLIRRAFHPFLFLAVMKFLRAKDGKSARQKSDVPTPFDEPEQEEDDHDDDEPTPSQAASVMNESRWMDRLAALLADLSWALDRFSLASFVESFEHTVETVSEMSRTMSYRKPKAKGAKRAQIVSADELKVVKTAYEVMTKLVSGRHGPMSRVLTPVLRELVACLTLTPPSGALPPTVPKQLLIDRDLTIEFAIRLAANPATHDSLLVLLQHTCIRIAEKADYRAGAVDSIAKIIPNLPDIERFIVFLIKYSKNTKTNFRMFSIEVALELLSNDRVQADSDKVMRLLGVLVQRSSDKASTVRSKALSCLAQLLQDVAISDRITPHVQNVFNLKDDSQDDEEGRPSLVGFLARRADDDKSGVRKSALQVLEVICAAQPTCNRAILNILTRRMADTSPLIRKQVIATLTLLLKRFIDDDSVLVAWRTSIFPLIADRESAVVDRAIDALNEMVFQAVIANESNPAGTSYLWRLLDGVVSGDLTPYLHKACSLMASRKLITPPLIKALQTVLRADAKGDMTSIGGWTLLAEIGHCCASKLDQSLILSTWNSYKERAIDSDDLVSALCTVLTLLESLAPHLAEKAAVDLFRDLLTRVNRYVYHPQHVQLFIAVLIQLTGRLNATKAEADVAMADWTRAILSTCEDHLAAYVYPQQQPDDASQPPRPEDSDATLGQYLFVIGELIQISQTVVPARLKKIVPALIAPTRNRIGAMGEANADKPIPQSVRAHAFITLGKLCLGDERLAKQCIATFAKELEISDSPIIRNNVMIVMCDLCIRYTAVVDAYIPNIARCLRDSSEVVRRQTLILLTRLLQEDYLKWRGAIFFRFVEALVDPSPAVASFANFCLVHVLQQKYCQSATAKDKGASGLNIFFVQFIETIFVLNECRAHPKYNQGAAHATHFSLGRPAANSGDAFSLRGDENRRKRMTIYTVFLQSIGDEHRIQLSTRLCDDILSEVAEGKMELADCANVVYDALAVLASKHIKMTTIGKGAAAGDDEEVSAAEVAMVEAKDKLMGRIVKKNVVESIVPIIIELKHLLERRRSPLVRELMLYLKELHHDYKSEMADIMAADRQLAKEIEFDLRNLNRKIVQSPARMSVGGARVSMSGANSVLPPSTPGKADLTNFVVPQLKTPRGSKDGSVTTNNASTPLTKPCTGGVVGARISITPAKLSFTPRMSMNGVSGTPGKLSFTSSHMTPIRMSLPGITPVKSALRQSIPDTSSSSSSSTTPFKPKSIRFSEPIQESTSDDDDQQSGPINIVLEAPPVPTVRTRGAAKANSAAIKTTDKPMAKIQKHNVKPTIQSTDNSDDDSESGLCGSSEDESEEEEEPESSDNDTPPPKPKRGGSKKAAAVSKKTTTRTINNVNKKLKSTHITSSNSNTTSEAEEPLSPVVEQARKRRKARIVRVLNEYKTFCIPTPSLTPWQAVL
eukprot:gene2517-2876_t